MTSTHLRTAVTQENQDEAPKIYSIEGQRTGTGRFTCQEDGGWRVLTHAPALARAGVSACGSKWAPQVRSPAQPLDRVGQVLALLRALDGVDSLFVERDNSAVPIGAALARDGIAETAAQRQRQPFESVPDIRESPVPVVVACEDPWGVVQVPPSPRG